MTARRLSAFIDALATDRSPKRFRVDPDDVDVLRAAIELRSARPGDGAPTAAFTDCLFRQLSDQLNNQNTKQIRPASTHRARAALLAAAAAAVLVAATAFATEALTHPATTRVAVQAPQGTALRTGTFQTAEGQVLGQIVAYRGSPSWVFMNVVDPNYDGPIKCMLQVDDGSTVAFGTFTVHDGTGQFSKTIGSVDVSHLRGAKLVTSTGSSVADATFAI
ncbi:MAG: hypothetical protein M3N95_18305 [Actinomycetota bacterium]|nr:hypothetical protein [Actinomycetota bacterium]